MAANRKVRAAAVQLAPSLSSRAATTEKVCAAIEAAAREGAELVVFPETVVPYYPYFSFVQSAYQIIAGGEHLKLLDQQVVSAVDPRANEAQAAIPRELKCAGVHRFYTASEREHVLRSETRE